MTAVPELQARSEVGHTELTMNSQDQLSDNADSKPRTLDYEHQRELDRQKQLRLIQDANVGSKEWTGQNITVIIAKSDNFLIYRVEGDRDDDSLRVLVANTSNDKEKIMLENYDKIQLELLEVYSAIPKSRNPKRALNKVGNAIAMVLEANPDDNSTFNTAKTICVTIAQQINTEYKRLIEGKLFYLIGCLSAAAVLSIVSFTCFYFIGNLNTLVQLLYAATFASYGGFISVYIALNQLVFETELQKRDYIFYGLTRILVSILGGIFVFMVVKSGLVLNVIADSSLFSVFVFCFVAGFSEKLVPDLLRKLEAREDENAK
ncbi:MAG: hypothetical protein ACRD39_02650 [Nitrososphaeraceae archaeon]